MRSGAALHCLVNPATGRERDYEPDALPEELIPQALEKFLQRNNVRGDLVAVSVPGSTSLIKFIKLASLVTRSIHAGIQLLQLAALVAVFAIRYARRGGVA